MPVGEDQLPLIEQAREIVRRFNLMYGETLTEPEALISKVSRLPGIDGCNKMSKSLGNAIYLADSPDEIKRKVMSMFTDPNHIRVEDPGKVEGNPVFTYLDAFGSDTETIEKMKEHYMQGGLGDVKVKKYLNEVLQEYLRPIREKREKLENDIGFVTDVLVKGIEKVELLRKKHLKQLRNPLGLIIKKYCFKRRGC